VISNQKDQLCLLKISKSSKRHVTNLQKKTTPKDQLCLLKTTSNASSKRPVPNPQQNPV